MIHEISDSIRNQRRDRDFLYPCYKENCISNIPGTILDLFNVKNNKSKLPTDISSGVGEEVNKVVILILDCFGYNQFLRYYKDNKFLGKLAEKSDVIPLTSIFPSQTTNALTTLNTGLTPQEHGLFEYYIYLKEIDMIVNTLRFEQVRAKQRDELVENGLNPNILLKEKTIQKKLTEIGINTFTHIYAPYAYSHGSKLIFDGSTMVPSLKSSDLIVNLRKNLEKEKNQAYFFVHLSNLDTIGHEYGPQSYEYGAELSAISYLLNKELIEKIDQKTAKETLVLVTSDHGGVNITPENTTYLNGFSELLENLQYSKRGKHILPTGSSRDVFLHVQEEKLTETKGLLAQRIGGKAKIVETKDEIKNGLFGLGNVKSEFLDRAGNLLILPYRNETVWFDHFKEMNYNPIGQHGGLSEEEMLVPLAITTLNNLK